MTIRLCRESRERKFTYKRPGWRRRLVWPAWFGDDGVNEDE
jgi:hypothetical protein